jgi:hypothetical protein
MHDFNLTHIAVAFGTTAYYHLELNPRQLARKQKPDSGRIVTFSTRSLGGAIT